MRERWGTFSVRDHVSDAPLVSEVLLYDRLVFPIPDPSDSQAEKFWVKKDWQPELLHECLEILKVKTEKKDGLALTIPWDASKRERFRSRMSTSAALAAQQRDPTQTYYTDPFQMTQDLVKDEFLPALPRGVSKAWAVAAYASSEAFRSDTDRGIRLAAVLSHRFLTPKESDPNHDFLKRAVDLATSDAFRRKRAHFYKWQEEIIQEEISDDKAIEELDKCLSEYNEATRQAFREVVAKYAFTVIPIGLTMTGAMLAGPGTGLVLAAASGLVQLTRFWKFDRKPIIDSGDLDAAAMVHDARKVLSLD